MEKPLAARTLLLTAALAVSGCLGTGPDAMVHDHAGDPPIDPSSQPLGSHNHGQSTNRTTGGSLLEPRGWAPSQAPDVSHEAPFPLENGTLPSREAARSFANGYSRFIAKGDGGLEKLRAEGHLQGHGTRASPFVLERFYIDGDLSITSTHQALILREGYVEGQLRLNYVGDEVYVHHVYATDLRVNENVERTGTNTGGLFHDNRFGFVGQIRHFVGEFRDSVIGPRPAGVVTQALGDSGVVEVGQGVVFNFDGFHAADVHDNTFIGQVDIKLHGHNHGDCFTCPVHDHALPPDLDPHGANRSHGLHEDPVAAAVGFRTHHSVRYASLAFHDNEIRVDGGPWAVRYNDRNHAGDDRTANSEPNEHVEDPHVHFQDVTLERNRLIGAGFLIDVFNAEDDHHPVQNRGILRLLDNDVTVRFDSGAAGFSPSVARAIAATQADGLTLRVASNVVRFVDASTSLLRGPTTADPDLTGIRLDRVAASDLVLEANVVESGTYGVFAMRLSETVEWTLRDNDFRTRHAWRGEDVSNPPQEE